MDRMELARRLVEASHLRGRFLLRSGTHSDEYFDKYRFAAAPDLLSAVAQGMAELIPQNVDLIAGIELGGVVIATAVSLASGRPMSFVRKARKEYGTQNIVEGAHGRRKSCLHDRGRDFDRRPINRKCLGIATGRRRVSTALCVVDRTGGNHGRLAEQAIELRALFTAADLSRV